MAIVYKIIYWIFLAAIVVVGGFLILSVLPIPGHIEMKIVKSGSMAPAIPVGALVIMMPESSYEVGQVITFGPDTATQIPTTHRIVAISGTGAAQVFTTKGDANDAPDPTQTPLSQVRGKVIFDIPYIGYILAFAKTKLGFLLLIGLPALAVCIEEIFKMIAEVKEMRKKKRGVLNERRGPVPQRASTVSPASPRSPDRAGQSRSSMDGVMRPHSPSSQGPRMYARNQQERHPGRSPSTGIGITLVALLIIGVGTAQVSGDTLSYYRSSETSPGNRFQSGTYPVPPVATTTDPTADSQDTVTADLITLPPPGSDSGDASSSDATTTDPTDPPPSDPPADHSSDSTSTEATSTEPALPLPDILQDSPQLGNASSSEDTSDASTTSSGD